MEERRVRARPLELHVGEEVAPHLPVARGADHGRADGRLAGFQREGSLEPALHARPGRGVGQRMLDAEKPRPGGDGRALHRADDGGAGGLEVDEQDPGERHVGGARAHGDLLTQIARALPQRGAPVDRHAAVGVGEARGDGAARHALAQPLRARVARQFFDADGRLEAHPGGIEEHAAFEPEGEGTPPDVERAPARPVFDGEKRQTVRACLPLRSQRVVRKLDPRSGDPRRDASRLPARFRGAQARAQEQARSDRCAEGLPEELAPVRTAGVAVPLAVPHPGILTVRSSRFRKGRPA